MKDKRKPYQIKIDATLRLAMWHVLKEPLGQVLVSEFPKSGGSWFCQMLSEALDMPFPRNKVPFIGPCILQGHHLYNSRFGKIIGVVRDGRDVMVSAYFYFLFENERNPSHLVQQFRKALPFSDYSDIKTNLPEFINYMFEQYTYGRFHFSWSEWVRSFYCNENVMIVKYENLLLDPIKELRESIIFLGKDTPGEEELSSIVERYSFKRLANRELGEEDRASFLRKGIAGDWRNYFSEEACLTFETYGGEALRIANYELDQSWVSSSTTKSG